MSDAPWKIAGWDRALARGTVACPGFETLHFDASHATVDDFVVGEGVVVELRSEAGTLHVLKVAPDDPHVPDPGAAAVVPPLDEEVATRVARLLSTMPVLCDYRVKRMEASLWVEADDVGFLHGTEYELELYGVEYLELPMAWSGKLFRLANATERAYLATRCEMRRDLVGLKIVDEERHAYFVVCGDVRLRE